MEERRAAQEEIAQQQEKVSQAQSELDAQQEQVRNFQVMTAEIEGMTSAYYQYLKALDTPNQGAIFDQVPSMVEALEEAVQSGRMFTDDVESTAQFIMGTGIDLSGDPKERKKQLNDIVKAANKYADDYKRIVKDLGGLEGVSVEGVEVSFAEGVTLDSLAEQWGLGPEMVQAMLDTLAEYGYNIPPLKVSVPEIEWTGDLSSAAKGLLDDLMGDAPYMGERGEKITRMQEF